MKKILLLAGVLLCMLLTACNGKKESIEEQEEKPVDEVVLYENQGVKVSLKATLSVESYGVAYVVTAENHNDLERMVSVGHWLINDKIVLEETETFYMDPNSEAKAVLTEMADAFLYEGVEAIESVQCVVSVDDENYENVEEKEVALELEQGMVVSLVSDLYLGARASRQVLIDNENVRATLLGWGKAPEGSYVRGVVYFENKSEETIPVLVSSVALNGIFFEGHDRVDFLKPGERCYGTCSILTSEVEREGVQSITDVSFLVLTEEAQNTGMVNYDGGEWYPLALSEQGENEESFEDGELLDKIGGVEISLLSQEMIQWNDGGGYYEWKLAVVNDSEENIELAVIDLLLDGLSEEEWTQQNGASFYISDRGVGAQGKRYVYLNVSFEELISRPELSFKFQIRSMAGGSVIDTGEQVITIAPDAQ